MRSIHLHEFALVSGGIMEIPSVYVRREMDGSDQNWNAGGLYGDIAWSSTAGSSNSASPATAMRMIGVGALLAAVGVIAVATAPIAAGAGLVGAAYSLGSVGAIAASGGGIFANYGWSLLRP